MKFLKPESHINEKTGLPEIEISLDHNEYDRIISALTQELNNRTWNFEDPTQVWDHTLLTEINNFMFKAWEATSVNDPRPIDPAVVQPIAPPEEFSPNQPAEDVANMKVTVDGEQPETEFPS